MPAKDREGSEYAIIFKWLRSCNDCMLFEIIHLEKERLYTLVESFEVDHWPPLPIPLWNQEEDRVEL